MSGERRIVGDGDFEIGDVITLGGVAADGTINTNKPQKKWRVKAFDGADVVLQPLNADGTVDVFNDEYGDFRIVSNTK